MSEFLVGVILMALTGKESDDMSLFCYLDITLYSDVQQDGALN